MESDIICIEDDETEREDGEIVDDSLEDISDDSISVPEKTGKLASHKERLRALSLSSVSDGELRTQDILPERENFHHKKKSHKLKKRRTKSRSVSTDSVMMKKLLNEAIRISGPEEQHHNSLRTRLRGMVKDDGGKESDKDEELSEDLNSEQIQNEESELMKLRLEALKTAVINKFQLRKKRKKDEDDLSEGLHKSDNEIDKENSVNNVNKDNCNENQHNKKPCLEQNAIICTDNSDEGNKSEDEDVLRAILLASMSKKITSSTESVITNTHNVLPGIIPLDQVTKINSMSLKPNLGLMLKKHVQKNNKMIIRPNLKIPPVKPLIINVNSDSDSDEDHLKNKSIKTLEIRKSPVANLIPEEIQTYVDKFLKDQRAEVEAKLSKESLQKTPVTSKKETIQKSAVKLLPKNKQLEYQRLLLRIKNAEKRTRVRRISHRTIIEQKNIKKIVRSKVLMKPAENKLEKSLEKKADLSVFHQTLKDMQTQQNGRLQIKGKYHVLSPLMKKITEASQERNKHELHIKQLLNQLNEARSKYAKSHQVFADLVTLLVNKKNAIDKSTTKIGFTQNIRYTSTPNGSRKVPENLSTNAITTFSPLALSANTTELPPKSITPDIEKQKILERKLVVENCPSDLLDPNDIIFKNTEIIAEKEVLPKYVSPLDKIDRNADIDPNAIVCPYEINGFCRDEDCSFKHYNKK